MIAFLIGLFFGTILTACAMIAICYAMYRIKTIEELKERVDLLSGQRGYHSPFEENRYSGRYKWKRDQNTRYNEEGADSEEE